MVELSESRITRMTRILRYSLFDETDYRFEGAVISCQRAGKESYDNIKKVL